MYLWGGRGRKAKHSDKLQTATAAVAGWEPVADVPLSILGVSGSTMMESPEEWRMLIISLGPGLACV